MATYTNLGIKKITTGDESGTWGTSTNTNFDYFDTAIVGYVAVTLPATGSSGTPNTINVADFSVSDGRNRVIEFVDAGDLGGTAYVQITPNDFEGYYFIQNSLSGSRSILLFQGTYDAGRDYEIPGGKNVVVRCTGGGTTSYIYNVLDNLQVNSLKASLSESTGLPVSTGISGLGTNVATFLATPSSANLAAAVTDETGSGALVFATGPTFSPDVVISGSSSNSALRITQTGTGNALLVEDSASTDSTPFLVTADGRVGMGVPNASYFPGNIGLYITANDGNYRVLFQRMSDDSSGPQFFFRKGRGTVEVRTGVQSGDRLGTFSFSGHVDASNNYDAASIFAEVDGTPGVNDMPGRLVFSTTADGASSPTERMRIDNAGNVGIGGTPTVDLLRLTGTATGSTTVNGLILDETVGSGVTANYRSILSRPILQDASFTLSNLYHFYTNPQTKPAAATLSNQYGFHAESTLTDATSNYGFYGNIASGTNRWNFYAAGTAANYFAGNSTFNTGLTVNGTTNLSALTASTALALDASKNVVSVTNTGSGNNVLATSPTLVTPALGTPSSGTLTNATGLPVSTGISGLGTNVATALAVNTGSAGAVVVNGGVLGTPSSGTLTNATGLPVTTGISGLGTGVATFLATPSSANLASAVTGETGSGALVFGTSPSLTGVTVGITSGTNAGINVTTDTAGTGTNHLSFSDSVSVPSVAPSSHSSFISQNTTADAVFTLPTFYGFRAAGVTKLTDTTAGATITTQYAFLASSNNTAATTNYGFYSDIAASGTSRYNFYAAGTAPNYFGGSAVISVTDNTNAALRVTQLGTANALEIEDTTNPDSSPFVVDANGVLIKGRSTTVSTKVLTTAGTLDVQVHGTGAATSSMALFNYANNATFPSFFVFNKSKSGTSGTLSAVTDGDSLGVIQFNGADNDATTSTFNPAAYISAQVAGAVASTSIPGRLNFATTAVAGASPIARVSITPEGYVGIGATPTSAAQLLDVRGTNTGLTSDAPVNILRFTDTDTTTAANQPIGKIEFYNSDTGNAAVGAYILSSAVGASGGGTIRFGAAADAGAVAEVARIASTGLTVTLDTAGLGYGTGTGGTVTQATSRTTGVTLNKTNGAITLVSAAGTATWQSFTVTNSTVAATDVVVLSQKSGTDLYMLEVTAVAAGSFRISFATTGGTTTEQPVFNFAVIKAVTA